MTRINERIRVPEVRLIDDEGTQIGVMKTADALAFAQERELDLVEVAPEARPPVCRVLDYSKYKYEQAQKQKQARKHQQQITIREIKFRPKIAQHDYDTKKNHVERFLRHKDKVKVTIMFRGREVTHPERGIAILDRLAQELAEYGVIEQHPTQEGRNMTMMLAPSKAVLSGRVDVAGTAAAESAEPGTDGVPLAPAPADGGASAQSPAADAAGRAAADATASTGAEAAAGSGEEPSQDGGVEPRAAGSEAPNGEVAIAADGNAQPARKASQGGAKAAEREQKPQPADATARTPVS
jgi:translation initiation factor IF-3